MTVSRRSESKLRPNRVGMNWGPTGGRDRSRRGVTQIKLRKTVESMSAVYVARTDRLTNIQNQIAVKRAVSENCVRVCGDVDFVVICYRYKRVDPICCEIGFRNTKPIQLDFCTIKQFVFKYVFIKILFWGFRYPCLTCYDLITTM